MTDKSFLGTKIVLPISTVLAIGIAAAAIGLFDTVFEFEGASQIQQTDWHAYLSLSFDPRKLIDAIASRQNFYNSQLQ